MKLFKKSRTKKRKFNGLRTLDDCKKYYLENPDYRYVLVVGREKSPYEMLKSIEDAKDSMKSNYINGGKLPMEVIDLLYEF